MEQYPIEVLFELSVSLMAKCDHSVGLALPRYQFLLVFNRRIWSNMVQKGYIFILKNLSILHISNP